MYPLFVQKIYNRQFWYVLLLLLCGIFMHSCGACSRKAIQVKGTLPSKKNTQSPEVNFKKTHAYVIGGYTGSGITAAVYKFDVTQLPGNPWKQIQD